MLSFNVAAIDIFWGIGGLTHGLIKAGIPVIAGIAYEFLKFSAKHQDNRVIKILIAPGLALQKMTTREPDLNMLEVSIAALKKLLEIEQLAEAPARSEKDPLAAQSSASV